MSTKAHILTRNTLLLVHFISIIVMELKWRTRNIKSGLYPNMVSLSHHLYVYVLLNICVFHPLLPFCILSYILQNGYMHICNIVSTFPKDLSVRSFLRGLNQMFSNLGCVQKKFEKYRKEFFIIMVNAQQNFHTYTKYNGRVYTRRFHFMYFCV